MLIFTTLPVAGYRSTTFIIMTLISLLITPMLEGEHLVERSNETINLDQILLGLFYFLLTILIDMLCFGCNC